jgi:hypothetical protein
MKPKYSVAVEGFRVIKEIQGSWTPEDYKSLLDLMEFDQSEETSPEDLKDLCLMSLQDLKAPEAAELVIKYRLGDSLNGGQIQNAAHEMLDEKLWEESADMILHERFFHVGSLLYQVSSGSFPLPDAVSVKLKIKALNDPAQEVLSQPIHESFVVRLVADGMEKDAALHRMFDESLASDHFPEADKIIWTIASAVDADGLVVLDLVSSGLWLDPLQGTESYESSAHPDEHP